MANSREGIRQTLDLLTRLRRDPISSKAQAAHQLLQLPPPTLSQVAAYRRGVVQQSLIPLERQLVLAAARPYVDALLDVRTTEKIPSHLGGRRKEEAGDRPKL